MNTRSPPAPVAVWDLFVRCFHWALVVCVVGNQFITEDGELAHQVLGYTATTLVLARIVWGFVGSRHARFSDFFPTPARLKAHLVSLRPSRSPATFHPGHNPLGAVMMLSLMALVLALGMTGWMQSLDAWWGDETLQDVHAGLAQALLMLAAAHAVAALVMGRVERTTLVTAMVTGIKRRR